MQTIDKRKIITHMLKMDLGTFRNTILVRIKKLNKEKKSFDYLIEELNNSINNEIDFDAIKFRKRGILGGLKSVEDKLLENLMKNQNLLKEEPRLYEVEELEEKIKLSVVVNKSMIEIMAKKKELVLELQEANNSLNLEELNVKTKNRISELYKEKMQL